MTEPELSLVVPVYNVAPYLPRCLESLASEPPEATEVILVDDGSSDDSPRLLAEWARTRPHARVIRQPNGGLSAARNSGLAQARGRFLAFVDADDFYDPGYYRRLAALCEAHDLDMAIGNATYHFEGRRSDQPIFSDAPPAGVVRGADFLRHRLRNRAMLHMVWMHVYRRAWLERNGLRFAPGRIHEDVPWTTRALLLAKRASYDAAPGYHYRQRVRRYPREEQDRRLGLVIESSIRNARALAELAENPACDVELRELLRWQLVDGALAIFHKVRKLSSPGLRRERLQDLRRQGVFALLWHCATEFAQRRRIARNYLKSLLRLG
jgi:glycosyltransferase involved in cell wall biosynthesis